MMAEGLFLLPGEEEEHKRARTAWMKAERAANEAWRQRSKDGAEFVHNLSCECGRNHLVRLSVVSGHGAQGFDRADRSGRVDPIDGADCDLKRNSQHLLSGLKPQNSVFKVVHHLLRRLGCTFDGKARAGAGQGVNPTPRPDDICRLRASSPQKKEAE